MSDFFRSFAQKLGRDDVTMAALFE